MAAFPESVHASRRSQILYLFLCKDCLFLLRQDMGLGAIRAKDGNQPLAEDEPKLRQDSVRIDTEIQKSQDSLVAVASMEG